MKPAGILMILYLVFLVARYRRSISKMYVHILGLTIAVEVFVNSGYFMLIGSNEVIYSDVLIGILTILTLFLARIRTIHLVDAAVFLSVIMSSLWLLLFPYRSNNDVILFQSVIKQNDINSLIVFNPSTILRIIRFFLFIICGAGMVNIGRKVKIDRVPVQYILSFSYALFGFLVFEIISKTFFGSMISYRFIQVFFGEGISTLDFLLARGGFSTIQGFTREPSHLALGLFASSMLIYLSNQATKRKKAHLFLSATFCLISASFAGLLFSMILLLLLIKVSKPTSTILALTGVGLLLVLIFMNNPKIQYLEYISSRFTNLFSTFSGSKGLNFSTSDQTRVMGIVQAFFFSTTRPLFGIGLGTFDTHAAIPSLLCNIGFIGVITWLLFVMGVAGKKNITGSNAAKTVCFLSFVAYTFSGNISIVYSISLVFTMYLIRAETMTFEGDASGPLSLNTKAFTINSGSGMA